MLTLMQGLELRDNQLVYREKAIDLSKRSLSKRLLEHFWEHNHSRYEELSEAVYGRCDHLSERYQEALRRNLSKLLSRTRFDLKSLMGQNASRYKFFAYSRETSGWMSFKIIRERGLPGIRRTNPKVK